MAKAKINPEFTYRTRDGQKVTDLEIVSVSEEDYYPVRGFIDDFEQFFTIQGYFYKDDKHPLDLIKQPVKKTKPARELEVIKDTPEVVPHRHHDLIVAWAKNPKLEVQFKSKIPSDLSWYKEEEPSWNIHYEYRFKPEEPRLLTIIGSDGKARSYPEPCRVKPKNRTLYYIPAMNSEQEFSQDFQWDSDAVDSKYFRKNFVHLTQEAAELHAKAMLGVD